MAGDENMVFYAVYTDVLRYYNIRFLNGSTVLQAGLWAYGDTPVYMGDMPVDPSGQGLSFLGWKPTIAEVTGDADYVADYKLIYARAFVQRTISGDYTSESITYVGWYAFRGTDSLERLYLPNVTSTNGYAFNYCGATHIDLPKATTMGNSSYGCVFANCTRLKSVNLPLVTSLGYEKAFQNCTALESIYLPNVARVNNYDFDGCSALTSVDMPLVTHIGSCAFQNCKAMNSVNAPKLSYVSGDAFNNCTSLESIDLTKVTGFNARSFKWCESLKTVNAPVAKQINNAAFSMCESLESVDITSATTIGTLAFEQCVALKSVRLPASPPTVAEDSFYGINSACVFYVPTGSLTAYQEHSTWGVITNTYSFVEEDRA